MESGDPVDTPMVEKSKLDEDTQGKAVHPTYYRGMAKPIEKHLHAVKIIFKYLRGIVNRGLWYPKDSSIALTAYANADHKSVAISSTEAEYIALSGCCAQVLWMRSQLTDYGLGFNKILILLDDLGVTAAKVCVTAAKQKLVLLMLLVYKLLLLVFRVNVASTKVTTAQRLRLLKEFLLSEENG
ncbi:hypothetical protein Tco_1353314 [Tanacetum coccineum]